MNVAHLIGRLGRDPEVRTTSTGGRIVSFSLATSESWRDKTTGERKERTQWHNIVVFNEPLGKIAEQYAKKGSRLQVTGAIETREYTDRDGVQRKTTEIVLRQFSGAIELLGDASGRPAPSEDSYGETRTRQPREQHDDPRQAMGDQPRGRLSDQLDDDIPF